MFMMNLHSHLPFVSFSVVQILLDVVSVFNKVSSISKKKQVVTINQDGIQVYVLHSSILFQTAKVAPT